MMVSGWVKTGKRPHIIDHAAEADVWLADLPPMDDIIITIEGDFS
jgi:hypothetical protein